MTLTVKDIITSSGAYPEREKSPENTLEVQKNASNLAKKINAFLSDLVDLYPEVKPLVEDPELSSGFRPSAVNAATPGAAKKSYHGLGKAADLKDNKQQLLAKTILADAEKHKENSLLTKHQLWLEHPDATKGKFTNWAHLDDGTRSARPVRVFRP